MDDRRRGPQGRRDAARADVPENQSGHGGEIAAEPDQGTYPGVAGKNMPTLRPDLVAVSASNLKSTLIDPGYITLADAGM